MYNFLYIEELEIFLRANAIIQSYDTIFKPHMFLHLQKNKLDVLKDIKPFAILKDTLYALYSGNLKVYQLDLKHLKGSLLYERSLKTLIPKFNPSWICESAGNIYIGDQRGILKWEMKSILIITSKH